MIAKARRNAKGDVDMVKSLVEYGADPSLQGWTPLIYAAWRGRTDVVKYLLGKGVDIDAVSPNGISALMMAVRSGQYDVVKLLLWEVADPNLKSDSGVTALDWAKKAGNSEIAELLKEAGAND